MTRCLCDNANDIWKMNFRVHCKSKRSEKKKKTIFYLQLFPSQFLFHRYQSVNGQTKFPFFLNKFLIFPSNFEKFTTLKWCCAFLCHCVVAMPANHRWNSDLNHRCDCVNYPVMFVVAGFLVHTVRPIGVFDVVCHRYGWDLWKIFVAVLKRITLAIVKNFNQPSVSVELSDKVRADSKLRRRWYLWWWWSRVGLMNAWFSTWSSRLYWQDKHFSFFFQIQIRNTLTCINGFVRGNRLFVAKRLDPFSDPIEMSRSLLPVFPFGDK